MGEGWASESVTIEIFSVIDEDEDTAGEPELADLKEPRESGSGFRTGLARRGVACNLRRLVRARLVVVPALRGASGRRPRGRGPVCQDTAARVGFRGATRITRPACRLFDRPVLRPAFLDPQALPRRSLPDRSARTHHRRGATAPRAGRELPAPRWPRSDRCSTSAMPSSSPGTARPRASARMSWNVFTGIVDQTKARRGDRRSFAGSRVMWRFASPWGPGADPPGRCRGGLDGAKTQARRRAGGAARRPEPASLESAVPGSPSRPGCPGCCGLILVLLVAGVARPQAGSRIETTSTFGVDIVIVLDASDSMRAEDFTPDHRLEAAKQSIRTFIEGGAPSDPHRPCRLRQRGVHAVVR